jgi:hypothetical protein
VRGWHVHELRTRRRALLIGIPAGLGGAALLTSGIAVGTWAARRSAARRAGPVERLGRRFGI